LPNIAVFARNHLPLLEKACAISATDPSRPVTFRSSRRWTGAKKALDKQETIQLFFAEIGQKGIVSHQAVLKNLVLDPHQDDPETKVWLEYQLPGTASEGLWSEATSTGAVKTLYVLSHCRKLTDPIPLAKLRKVSDGKPISNDFAYSYALIFEPELPIDVEIHPEEFAQPSDYFEGAIKRVAVNAYERNHAARIACLNHYGRACMVCGFSFGKVYGSIGEDFIHVHHVKPLASIKAGYQIQPISDLRPVCPNCHAMLHRRDPPYSIEELSTILNGKA